MKKVLLAIGIGLFVVPFAQSPSFGFVENQGSLTENVETETRSPGRQALAIDLNGWTYSPSLSQMDGRKPNSDGSQGDPMSITTQFAVHTPAIGPMDFVVLPQFSFQPNYSGERFSVLNPTIGLQGSLHDKDGFSLWSRFELEVPATAKSQEKRMIIGPQTVQVASYRIPGSKFRVDAVVVPALNLYHYMDTSSFLYVSPRLYYLSSDSLWLVTLLETAWETKKGSSLFDLQQSGSATLGAGFRYISDNGRGLWIQPFLNVYPFGKVASTAHLGVMFGGPLL